MDTSRTEIEQNDKLEQKKVIEIASTTLYIVVII